MLLSEEPGRAVSEVAERLGIKNDLLYRWRRQLQRNGEIAFPGNGKIALTSDQKRIRDLEVDVSIWLALGRIAPSIICGG